MRVYPPQSAADGGHVDIDTEYVMRLSIKLNDLRIELAGVVRNINILERDLGIR